MTATRNTRRTLQGTVAANGAAKTITVVVERTFRHARYGKFVRQRKKYMAHDEAETAKVGDFVEIVATRPLSKQKRWRLGAVLSSSAFGASMPVSAELAEQTALEITGAKEASATESEGGES